MRVICTGNRRTQQCDAVPPQDSDALVARMTHNVYRGQERRSQIRFIVAAPVVAQVVDEQYAPVGEPFQVILRDISTGGVCLLHPTSIESRFLAVTLAHPTDEHATVQVVVEICSRRVDGPMFRIGASFVPCNSRLDQPHETGPPRGDYSGGPYFPDFQSNL